MLVSCNRWLGFRLDLFSGVFVLVVALAAILVTENPGELVRVNSFHSFITRKVAPWGKLKSFIFGLVINKYILLTKRDGCTDRTLALYRF